MPADDILQKLLSQVGSTSPHVAAGSAIGVVTCMHALEGTLPEVLLAEVHDSLLGQVASFAGGGDADQMAVATAVTCLGWLVSHCSWSTSQTEQHPCILSQTFSLALHVLTTLAPALEPVLMQIVHLLPHESLLNVQQSSRVGNAVSALEHAIPESCACVTYAAVNALVAIVEAAPAGEAEALSPLLPALIKVTQGRSEGLHAEYGVLVAAVAFLPRTVAALNAAGLPANAAAVMRPELPKRVLGSASDACIHRAAAVAQAQLLVQQGTNSDCIAHLDSSTLSDLLACVKSCGGAGEGSTKLSKSRPAMSEAAMVYATLLGTLPGLGSVRRACTAGVGHGLLKSSEIRSVGMCKEVAHELERCGLSKGSTDLLSAWLLARCARVSFSSNLQ
jgi:hypothetical protein